MAASEATALLDDLCVAGYTVVNVDYALVPNYHFPVPLIRANQAFAWAKEHADEYHLDMKHVVIMGSSAGAIMASQLGSEYRTDMNEMHDALDEAGVVNELADPLVEDGKKMPHCFVAAERTDPIARKAFLRPTAFLDQHCS